MLVLAAGMHLNAKAETLTLVSADWCPFICESDKPGVLAKKPGFVVDIVKTIFERQGYQVLYAAPPWSRAIFDARMGRYTGILAALKNDAPDFIYPEEELGVNHMCFYVKAGSTWRYDGLPSLASVILGVVQDYAYDNGVLDEYIKKCRAEKNGAVQAAASGRGLEQNLQNIQLGRITAILEERDVVEQYLKRHNVSEKYQQAGCLNEVKMYVGFSPAHEKSNLYAALFSSGMKELRRSGKLNDILHKYGMKDWKRQ
jgi:polar amino acid transport system substrate-binding protein